MQDGLQKLARPLEDNKTGSEREVGRGENLRYDVLYDQIKEAREEEDATLSQGVWERDLKKADWELVRHLCTDALETRTKDLQVVAWWGEAACHLDAWQGLLDAFTLMREFCERCWDVCYPILEDPSADLEYRVRILDWFLEKTSECALFMPITAPIPATAQPLTLAMWMMALNFDQVARRTGSTPEEDAETITPQKFRANAKQASIKQLERVLDFVGRITEQAQGLQDFLRERCQGQEPSFKAIMDPLSEVEKICRTALAGREQKQPAVSEKPVELEASVTVTQSSDVPVRKSETEGGVETPLPSDPIPNVPSLPDDEVTISGREDAYKAIEDLAHFLSDLDPQAPGPYLLKLVATWKDKTLPDIMDDVMSGTSEGHKILKLLAGMVAKN